MYGFVADGADGLVLGGICGRGMGIEKLLSFEPEVVSESAYNEHDSLLLFVSFFFNTYVCIFS